MTKRKLSHDSAAYRKGERPSLRSSTSYDQLHSITLSDLAQMLGTMSDLDMPEGLQQGDTGMMLEDRVQEEEEI